MIRSSFATTIDDLALEILKDTLAVGEFLGHEASSGEHGKTTVLKLLGLHDLELFGVSGHEAKRIESEVSGNVVVTEKTGPGDRNITGINPSDFGALLFGSTDGSDKEDPEERGDLGEVSDGRARDLGIKKDPSTASPTRKPTTASMATRPWVSSASR